MDQLNTLAKGIVDEVNALQNPTSPAAGRTSSPAPPGEEASTIAVNAAVVADPSLVVTGAAGARATGPSPARSPTCAISSMFVGGTQTASDFYADLIGAIGSDAQQANAMSTNQGLVVNQLTMRRESVSGVSLDEEATDMIRFQRAYQAAARVITIVDEMLDMLINRTGLVGR